MLAVRLFLVIALSAFISSFSQASALVPAHTSALEIEKFATDLPVDVKDFLSRDRLAEVKTQKLKNAQVAWVNIDLLRQLGFEIPAEGITQELEEKILESFAYVVPSELIPKGKLTEKTKIFYADRYGGQGMGGSEGSGRAAGAGLFQVKGIGRTPLASELPTEFDPVITWNPKSWSPTEIYKNIKSRLSTLHHSHGGATLREAMAEAIWGEILNRELPFGANRVLAVITTDLKIGVMNESRALIVRQNSLRPAHFMVNYKRSELDSEKESSEISKINKQLVNFFNSLGGQDFKEGQREFVRRVGRTFAVEYARSIFHGSLSPSNIEITGRAIDHGPLTYIDGYTKALFADDFPNGDPRDLLDTILNEFFEDFRQNAPNYLRETVFSESQVKQTLESAYNLQLQLEFLWLAGCPDNLRRELLRNEKIRIFANLLKTIAESGNNEVISVRFRVPKNRGDYDLPQILTLLSENPDSLELQNLITDNNLRTKLVTYYKEYRHQLFALMTKEGYPQDSIKPFLQNAVEKRNYKLFGLMRGLPTWARFYTKIFVHKITESAAKIGEFIHKYVRENTRTLPDLPSHQVLIDEISDYRSGSLLRRKFDALEGGLFIEGNFLISRNIMNIFGQKLLVTELNVPLALKLKDGRIYEVTANRIENNQVTLEFLEVEAVEPNTKIITAQVKFDGSKDITPIDENVFKPIERGLKPACAALF